MTNLINTTVFHPAFGKGTVISISEKSVEVAFADREMNFAVKNAFNLTTADGKKLFDNAAPAKVKKVVEVKEVEQTLESQTAEILNIGLGGRYNNNQWNQEARAIVISVLANGTEFEKSVAKSVLNSNMISEKQSAIIVKSFCRNK